MSKMTKYLSLPFICQLITSSSLAFSDTILNGKDKYDERLFPSKTYFLMAVDREINSNIQVEDIGMLLQGVPMMQGDADMLYHGMRKAMLKYASRAWDVGLADSYGRELGMLLGWQGSADHSEVENVQLQNKLMLFRYAQQYESSKRVMDRFHQDLIATSQAAATAQPLNNELACKQYLMKTDYGFYRRLGVSGVRGGQAIAVAFQYEALAPCQKMVLEQQLLNGEQGFTQTSLLANIVEANALDCDSSKDALVSIHCN